MKYLLDTDTCIYLIKQKPPQVLEKLRKLPLETICISSITLSELEYGIENSSRPMQNRLSLLAFLSPFHLLDFDSKAAKAYGQIRYELQKSGTIIGAMDLLIAAHALSQKLTLVTNNLREFQRVKELKVETWA